MIKVFICGPMTGRPEFNYPAFFRAEEALTARGYEALKEREVAEWLKIPMFNEAVWLELDLLQLLERAAGLRDKL